MLINKIGFSHWELGKNCQDAGIETTNVVSSVPVKAMADGCSSCPHSEVGAQMFCGMIKYDHPAAVMSRMVGALPYPEQIMDFMMFTALVTYEMVDKFVVHICGDGVIIKQKHDDTVEYEIFDYNNMPPYYAYNFFDESAFPKDSPYAKGVSFRTFTFLKTEYKAVGIASDGLNYILNTPFEKEFEEALILRKPGPINRMINREHMRAWKQKNGIFVEGEVGRFQDDITIVI